MGILLLTALPNNLGLLLHEKKESIRSGIIINRDFVSGSIRHANSIVLTIEDFDGTIFYAYFNNSSNLVKGDSVRFRNLYSGKIAWVLSSNGTKINGYWRWWDFFSVGIYVFVLIYIIIQVLKKHENKYTS